MAITSQEQRRAVCFHVAGRAIIHKLAGAHVYRVAVAPINSPDWTYEPRKGSVLTGFNGYCEASDVPEINQSVAWSDKHGRFVGYREEFESMIEDRRRAYELVNREAPPLLSNTLSIGAGSCARMSRHDGQVRWLN